MNFLRPDLLRAFAAQQLDRAITLENEAQAWNRAARACPEASSIDVRDRLRFWARFYTHRDQARADRDRCLLLAQVADANAERLAAWSTDLDVYPGRTEELERRVAR